MELGIRPGALAALWLQSLLCLIVFGILIGSVIAEIGVGGLRTFMGSLIGVVGIARLFEAIRASTLRVLLSEEGIMVRGVLAFWSEIDDAVIRRASGMRPIISLRTRAGTVLEIPAATSSLSYVMIQVEEHVDHVTKEH